LTIARDELVVGLELVQDARLYGDTLGAEHFLDLKKGGVVVLEHDADR
jgi:hypothetical protein